MAHKIPKSFVERRLGWAREDLKAAQKKLDEALVEVKHWENLLEDEQHESQSHVQRL